MDLIGVAEGGIPADYIHTTAYINGSSSWAGAIPAVTLGLIRAYKLDVAKYASAKGMQIFKQVEQGCLNPTAYPGLKLEDLLKPQYKDWKKVPIFVKIFNASIMSEAGTPRGPLLMGVGNVDGTGDGVMIDKDVQELAYIYCTRKVSVQFHVYSNSDHVEAAPQFEAQAVPFLQALYAGQPVANECGSFGSGNPFTPLPQPSQSGHAPAELRLHTAAVDPRLHGVAVSLSATHGTLHGVTVELKRGKKLEAKVTLARLGANLRRVVLRTNGRMPAAGRYTLTIFVGRTAVLHRTIVIRRAALKTR